MQVYSMPRSYSSGVWLFCFNSMFPCGHFALALDNLQSLCFVCMVGW